MSRSHRKHPCYHIGCPANKKVANKFIRRYKGEIGNYNFYKKLYESYNIIDWCWYDYTQIRKNKEFRKAAKIIRDIAKGRVPIFKYNLLELKETLINTAESFSFIHKK